MVENADLKGRLAAFGEGAGGEDLGSFKFRWTSVQLSSAPGCTGRQMYIHVLPAC